MYQELGQAVSPGLLRPMPGLGLARSELLPLSIYHFPLLAFTLKLRMKADTASFWMKRAETLRLTGATGIVVKLNTGIGRLGF